MREIKIAVYLVIAISSLLLISWWLFQESSRAPELNVTIPEVDSDLIFTASEIDTDKPLSRITKDQDATVLPATKECVVIVACQVVEGDQRRSPLADVKITIQTVGLAGTENYSEEVSGTRGFVEIVIPENLSFTIQGEWGPYLAKREIQSMSCREIQDSFPDGIQLDFFFAPCSIRYTIEGINSNSGKGAYFSVGSKPFPEFVIPRNSEHSDYIPFRTTSEEIVGSFQYRHGSELHWALHNQFGAVVLRGRSGRFLEPGEEFEINISLSDVKVCETRYFLVIEGEELFTEAFMWWATFDLFDNMGRNLGMTEGKVGSDSRFSLNLPSAFPIKLVFHHPLGMMKEIVVEAGEGESFDSPIEVSFSSAPRIFLHKEDYPEVIEGLQFTVVNDSGTYRNGVVAGVKGEPGLLELIGGWSKNVRSFRLMDRLFLVALSSRSDLVLPDSEFQELPIPDVVPCVINIQASTRLHQTVLIKFFFQEELWQIHRIYNPSGTKIRFDSRLPNGPGTVVIQEGFEASTSLPFQVFGDGTVQINWIR